MSLVRSLARISTRLVEFSHRDVIFQKLPARFIKLRITQIDINLQKIFRNNRKKRRKVLLFHGQTFHIDSCRETLSLTFYRMDMDFRYEMYFKNEFNYLKWHF